MTAKDLLTHEEIRVSWIFCCNCWLSSKLEFIRFPSAIVTKWTILHHCNWSYSNINGHSRQSLWVKSPLHAILCTSEPTSWLWKTHQKHFLCVTKLNSKLTMVCPTGRKKRLKVLDFLNSSDSSKNFNIYAVQLNKTQVPPTSMLYLHITTEK